MLEIELIVNSILVGIILITQFISYPLFLKVHFTDFKEYHTVYTKSIFYIVTPFMIIELFINIYNFYHFRTIQPLYFSSSFILLFIWLSTILIQLPLHNNVSFHYDKLLIKQLIKSNWIRTGLWITKLLILINIKEL
tara:strand:- start:1763 stop:2173 length:411 start_codon:yes stop_codon:yes gene_type:complete